MCNVNKYLKSKLFGKLMVTKYCPMSCCACRGMNLSFPQKLKSNRFQIKLEMTVERVENE